MALCGGVYDDRPAGELTLIISRGSTFAITMVYGLTQLVAAVGTAAELSGHTRRIAALLRGLEHVEQTTGGWRRREEETWRPQPRPPDPGDAAGALPKGATSGVGRRRHSREGVEPLLEGRRLCVSVPPVAPPPYRGGSWGLRMSSSSAFLNQVDLLRGIDLCVREGGSLLVRGSSGRGKTALLRTICGLWPMGDLDDTAQPAELVCVPPLWNRAARRANSRTYLVVPQSAPLRPGMQTSLRQQLLYPLLDTDGGSDDRGAGVSSASNEALRDALDAVGLSGLVARVGGLHTPRSPQEWHATLSPGQRQLLICARIFVHRPALVLLDEATSAMPAADEARIYAKLKARGTAYVSIGHRASLEPHHDEIIDL